MRLQGPALARIAQKSPRTPCLPQIGTLPPPRWAFSGPAYVVAGPIAFTHGYYRCNTARAMAGPSKRPGTRPTWWVEGMLSPRTQCLTMKTMRFAFVRRDRVVDSPVAPREHRGRVTHNHRDMLARGSYTPTRYDARAMYIDEFVARRGDNDRARAVAAAGFVAAAGHIVSKQCSIPCLPWSIS